MRIELEETNRETDQGVKSSGWSGEFLKATPRPWRADRHDIVGGEGKNYVALICAGGTRTGNANRNLILTAVNSHDALREAAENALTYIEDTGESCRNAELITQLRKALGRE